MIQQNNVLTQNPANYKGLILLLALFQMIVPISVDLSLPAMPSIAQQMQIDHSRVQTTLSAFLLIVGCGQLAWGPVGDRFGRKLPLLIAALLYIASGIGCALSKTVDELVIYRIFQGFGAAGMMVLGSAMTRDLFTGVEEVRVRSLLLLLTVLGPIGAPLIGGQIVTRGSWPSVFWLQVAICTIIFVGVFRISESLPLSRRSKLPLVDVVLKFGRLFGNKKFVGYALAGACINASFLAFLVGSPFVYITYFRVGAQYFGWYTAINVLGIVLASAINRRLVASIGADRLLLLGICIGVLGATSLLVAVLTGSGGFPAIMVAIFLCISMVGLTLPNSVAMALSRFPENTGIAAAMCGALSTALGGVAGTLIGLWANGTPLAMAKVIALFMFSGLGSYLFLLGLPNKRKL